MDADRYEVLVNLLNAKKNIILQGVPGVGKTFTATRLAYSIMVKRDTSRVMMVQFHQSYQQFCFYLLFFIFYHGSQNNQHFFTFSPNFSEVRTYLPLTPLLKTIYSIVSTLRGIKYKFSIILQQIQPF